MSVSSLHHTGFISARISETSDLVCFTYCRRKFNAILGVPKIISKDSKPTRKAEKMVPSVQS